MRVQFYPADMSGCAHFRCIFPAQAAEAEGLIEWECGLEVPSTFVTQRSMMVRDGQMVPARPVVRPNLSDATPDVVVWQRPIPYRQTVELMEGFAAKGIANVVDLDDDFSCLHPHHPAMRMLAGGYGHNGHEVNARWYRPICQLADMVTVSTPALAARYGTEGRVVVLRNRVPDSMLSLTRESDGRTLGWTGMAATHPGDLSVTHGGVAQAVRDADWRFHVVGSAAGVQRDLRLDEEPTDTGVLELEDWHRALGKIDVGIVPLGDTKFNAAKSALKGLEYAALGIPFVASPTPEYERLADEGAGFLASPRGRSWRSQLLKLMRDDGLSSFLAEQGKDLIECDHLYAGNGWRWVEAWQAAIDNRKGQRASVSH